MWKCNWKIKLRNDPDKVHIYYYIYAGFCLLRELQTLSSAVPLCSIHISSSLATGENNKNIADFHFGKSTFITELLHVQNKANLYILKV